MNDFDHRDNGCCADRRAADRRQTAQAFDGDDRRLGERRSGDERRRTERRSGLERRSARP